VVEGEVEHEEEGQGDRREARHAAEGLERRHDPVEHHPPGRDAVDEPEPAGVRRGEEKNQGGEREPRGDDQGLAAEA
jgi:hypothetical protein